jgi:hypothetical protein
MPVMLTMHPCSGEQWTRNVWSAPRDESFWRGRDAGQWIPVIIEIGLYWRSIEQNLTLN